jgi:hypothetical protein
MDQATKLRIERYQKDLAALNSRWYPHEGQKKAIEQIFSPNGKKLVFINAGGNWGKSSFGVYLAWRFGALFDNQSVFFIGAEKKQQKEIVWEPQGTGLAIKEFGGPEFKRTYNETELRIEFPERHSFIKVDGSDNAESYRGIPYDVMIFDEWKDHRYKFYEAVYPRRFKKKDAKIIIIGTPPDQEDHHFVRQVEQVQNDPDWLYIHGTCWDNPHIDHKELEKEKVKYYKRGDGALWEREYEAKLVFGGSSSIFPMWDKQKHTCSHSLIVQLLEKDRGKLKWFTVADPGSTSCFAVLFGAYNPYTSQIYILDEIYEKDHSKTSSAQIFARIQETEKRLYPDHPKKTFRRIYDEAAAWFAEEISYNFREHFFPTQKSRIDKESQISLIKDMFLGSSVLVSDKCVNFADEIRSYKTDEKGKVPKGKDHLIDCFRYVLAHFNYRFIEGVERHTQQPHIRTPEQAISQMQQRDDWTSFADDPYLH